VYTQEIPFTDFQLDEVKLYHGNNVIHLPASSWAHQHRQSPTRASNIGRNGLATDNPTETRTEQLPKFQAQSTSQRKPSELSTHKRGTFTYTWVLLTPAVKERCNRKALLYRLYR
jgi:hypothetical protein